MVGKYIHTIVDNVDLGTNLAFVFRRWRVNHVTAKPRASSLICLIHVHGDDVGPRRVKAEIASLESEA